MTTGCTWTGCGNDTLMGRANTSGWGDAVCAVIGAAAGSRQGVAVSRGDCGGAPGPLVPGKVAGEEPNAVAGGKLAAAAAIAANGDVTGRSLNWKSTGTAPEPGAGGSCCTASPPPPPVRAALFKLSPSTLPSSWRFLEPVPGASASIASCCACVCEPPECACAVAAAGGAVKYCSACSTVAGSTVPCSSYTRSSVLASGSVYTCHTHTHKHGKEVKSTHHTATTHTPAHGTFFQYWS